jgi:ABC-type bacteriocin/lantibiotic exporter with double-glycine peptidase domain
MAFLDPVVEELPLGLATAVGMGGNQLSGGQRQRVGYYGHFSDCW